MHYWERIEILIVEGRSGGMLLGMDKLGFVCEISPKVEGRGVYVDVADYLTEEPFELLNRSLSVTLRFEMMWSVD